MLSIISSSSAKGRTGNQQLSCGEFPLLVCCQKSSNANFLPISAHPRRSAAKILLRAAGEFGKWDKAGGKVLPGLLKRRQAERDMFNTPAS
jgi:lysozyme